MARFKVNSNFKLLKINAEESIIKDVFDSDEENPLNILVLIESIKAK